MPASEPDSLQVPLRQQNDERFRKSILAFINSKKGIALFFALVLALFLPSMVYGTVGGDDLLFHLNWFASYKDAVANGEFYPRWLPDEYAGMGSPALYFYPPFATFVFGLVDFLSLHHLTELRIMTVAIWIMSAMSGISFYYWARIFVGSRTATYAALFYAVAPYHLMIDYYSRAAMAEYAAYIWIPLIFAGIHQVIGNGDKKAVACLGFGIAGLFCTHLLTAMVIGPFAAIYALIRLNALHGSERQLRLKRLVLLAGTGFCGIALAAFYYLPALTQLKYTNSHMLNLFPVYNTPLFRGIVSRLIKGDTTPLFLATLRMTIAAAAYVLATGYFTYQFFLKYGKAVAGQRVAAPVLFWAGIVLLLNVTMAGAFAFVFKPPSPYEQIQFLWRLMILVEFAALSLMLYVLSKTQKEGVSPVFVGFIFVVGLAQLYIVANKFDLEENARINPMESVSLVNRLGPAEYFPNGTTFDRGVPLMMSRLQKYIKDASPASIVHGNGTISSAVQNRSNFTILLTAEEDVQVAIHQFYFPGWRAVDENGNVLAIVPAGEDQVASFAIGKGQHRVVVTRIRTDSERAGFVVSIIGLLSLIVLVFLVRGNAGGASARQD